MSWTVPPSRAVRPAQPSQSSSARPSSIETIGYWPDPVLQQQDHPLGVELVVAGGREPVAAGSGVVEVAGGDVERDADVLAHRQAAGDDGLEDAIDGLLIGPQAGAVAPFVADEEASLAVLLQHRAEGAVDRGGDLSSASE